MEKIYFCHRCDFYCDTEYNNYSNVCPECNSKMYLVEGTPEEIDAYINTHKGYYEEPENVENYL